VALFSVTRRVPRNHFRPKGIRPENILKFSDSDLRTVRVADRVRILQEKGGLSNLNRRPVRMTVYGSGLKRNTEGVALVSTRDSPPAIPIAPLHS
jgi:hypothetical protein